MAVKKYLAHYAEPEVALLDQLPIDTSYDGCLVIPACNETFSFIQRFFNQFSQQNILLIVVVNQTDRADLATHTNNQKLLQHIQQKFQPVTETRPVLEMVTSGDAVSSFAMRVTSTRSPEASFAETMAWT